MRTPHLATAMLAAAAVMGGSQGAAMEYTLRPDTSNAIYAAPQRTSRRSKGRVAQNQRQRRKYKRRAHAAGSKRAFSA
jgi:hypothetical protein